MGHRGQRHSNLILLRNPKRRAILFERLSKQTLLSRLFVVHLLNIIVAAEACYNLCANLIKVTDKVGERNEDRRVFDH